MAKIEVTFIHNTKAIRTTVAEVIGKLFSSFENKRLAIVTAAIIAANGNEAANPHPCVWGFMTLIHTHINAPI
jgi:hypothetical protein